LDNYLSSIFTPEPPAGLTLSKPVSTVTFDPSVAYSTIKTVKVGSRTVAKDADNHLFVFNDSKYASYTATNGKVAGFTNKINLSNDKYLSGASPTKVASFALPTADSQKVVI
jgi:hypothetical protein